jgi:hypothetical protein
MVAGLPKEMVQLAIKPLSAFFFLSLKIPTVNFVGIFYLEVL